MTDVDPPLQNGIPFPESLCHRCRYLRVVRSRRGSAFLQCTHVQVPRYVPQPVRECPFNAPPRAAGDNA